MMLSLRQKLFVAFTGMLAMLAVVGGLSVLLVTKYSVTIETLLRENYDSVIYGQAMRDAVDEMDDQAQAALLGTLDAEAVSAAAVKRFDENLAAEKGNITLEGEAEAVAQLESAWQAYRAAHGAFLAIAAGRAAAAQAHYRAELAPKVGALKALCQRIIDLNLSNIAAADGQVRESSRRARGTMLWLVVGSVALAALLAALLGRAVLRPVTALTTSVREVERGNLDLTVKVRSRDELGHLAEAFNAMATSLRENRRADRAKLLRLQKTTQLALNTFPSAVAIIGLDGRVELANEMAQRSFALAPGGDLARHATKPLWQTFETVFTTLVPVRPTGYDTALQLFLDGHEHFYLPQGVPIVGDDGALLGVTLVLTEVTELRRLDEMKSGLLSVVSHELKTPLTSIRMSTHLLLDERLGHLSPKQAELVLTARDDAERLNQLVDKLLDMGRIQSGRGLLELVPVAPERLVNDAIERFTTAYRDRGVALATAVTDDLPRVMADATRIGLVFSNLLDNALKYTPSGGVVRIDARREGEDVLFEVKDTGSGIAAEDVPHIFERFYRAPHQAGVKGAGLGLAIAKEIAEAHGGALSVASKPGSGTTFTLRLKPEVTHG